jgi:hypothetical protein
MACLFDSLSNFLIDINSHQLRQIICNYIQTNPKIIDDIDINSIIEWDSNINLNDYVSKMRNNSEWGGSIEIKSFCDIFGIDVIVIYNNETIHFKSKYQPNNYEIYLNYTGNHYTPNYIKQK